MEVKFTNERFLEFVRARKSSGRGFIGTADAYLRELQGCLSAGGCAASAAKLATAEQWAKSLGEAELKPVYTNDELVVDKSSVLSKVAGKTPQTEGSILDFECVITSVKKDRDGDVLESRGAIPDPAMPLLWQHSPWEPIGKMVAITGQNSKRVTGKFAIADTQLGRDAAVLTEFGALRISHGFSPLEYEPLEGKDASPEEWTGFRVLKFEIMETSLVSVPSNTDAIILAQSRGKLHHPAVKGWAEGFVKSRPTVVKVGLDLSLDTSLARKQLDVLDGLGAGGLGAVNAHEKGSDLPPNHEAPAVPAEVSPAAEPAKACVCGDEKEQELAALKADVARLSAELAAAKSAELPERGIKLVFAEVLGGLVRASDDEFELFREFQRAFSQSMESWQRSRDDAEWQRALAEFAAVSPGKAAA
jgi:hypothetical protein